MKVLTYNIWVGGEERIPAIQAIIRSEHADAVALIEADNYAHASALARALDMQFVFGEANSASSIAWLSHLPIQRSQNHQLAVLAKTLLEIEVIWMGQPLHLFATHLGARGDAHQPAEEIPVILEVLHPLMKERHLLVGDFNALRPGDPVGIPPHGVERRGDAADGAPRRAIQAIIEAGYLDSYRALHPLVPGYTYPSDAPWLRLDYVFASPAMASHLHACSPVTGLAAEQASDHFPLWAEFH